MILCFGLSQIADFGMSRDLMDENYYISHGGIIPVKWTAPEVIRPIVMYAWLCLHGSLPFSEQTHCSYRDQPATLVVLL